MALGSSLFNQMLTNCKNSISRKRFNYVKPRQIKEDYIIKEELQNLVWKMPLNNVAEKLSTTTGYIKKWCVEWGINRPDSSY